MTVARQLLLASLFCTAALGGGTAHAASPADQGWYVGAGAGRLHFNGPWSLRLQGDRSEVSGVEVDGYWLGVEYRFAR